MPRLFPVLLFALFGSCASAPRASLRLLVDGPLQIEGFSGGAVQLTNLGPGELGYEYRNSAGMRTQGELGVGLRLQFDLTGVRSLRIQCRNGAVSEATLQVHGGGELHVLPLPKDSPPGALLPAGAVR